MLRTYLYIPDELGSEIENLAKRRNESKAEVIRSALRRGIVFVKAESVGSAELLLKVGRLGKKNKVHGPKDVSLKIDEYLWENE